MWKLVLIAAGGGIGSVLRYLVAGGVQSLANRPFPFGTLAVNVIGCFAIGLLAPTLIRSEYRAFLLIGMLGGFTTFSTFGWETFSLGNDRQFLGAAANVVTSTGLGLIAVWFGYRLSEAWHGVT